MPVPGAGPGAGAGAAQGSWIENTDAGCRAGQYDYAAALLVTADEAGCRSRGLQAVISFCVDGVIERAVSTC